MLPACQTFPSVVISNYLITKKIHLEVVFYFLLSVKTIILMLIHFIPNLINLALHLLGGGLEGGRGEIGGEGMRSRGTEWKEAQC